MPGLPSQLILPVHLSPPVCNPVYVPSEGLPLPSGEDHLYQKGHEITHLVSLISQPA